jgi:hypothetical protein
MISVVCIVQASGQTTEPSVWEVRKRGPGGCGIPKPRSTSLRPQQTARPQQRKRLKMSDDSLSGEPFDYCNDVVSEVPPNQGGSTPPSCNRAVPRHGSISSLDLEIAERQLQLLQWRRAMEMQEPGVNSSTYSPSEMTESFGQPSYSRDQKSRRRVALKQQQAQEVTFRDAGGPRKHLVEVDLRGHPQGQNRPLWLTCLRGHAQDIDFSEDNYKNLNTSMLLAVKERVDNTFEYHGGLGKVTEEAFHSILKGQLKVKRYQLKKRMQDGKDKPKHIRHDHWVKLSKLILEEKKQHKAEKLRYSRAQVKRPSSAGRNEEYVRANLVSFQYLFSCLSSQALQAF